MRSILTLAAVAVALAVFADPASAQCLTTNAVCGQAVVQQAAVLATPVAVPLVQTFAVPYAVPSVPLAVVQQQYAAPVIVQQKAVVQQVAVQKVAVAKAVHVQQAAAPVVIQQRGLFNRVRR